MRIPLLYQYNNGIPRHKTTKKDERRAKKLGVSLTKKKIEQNMSVQALSTRSDVPYETVRSLLKGKSAGPSFFLVADVAKVLDKRLDDLVDEVR